MLVNGGITHQKQQISEKGDITQHDIAYRCQCTAEQYHRGADRFANFFVKVKKKFVLYTECYDFY